MNFICKLCESEWIKQNKNNCTLYVLATQRKKNTNSTIDCLEWWCRSRWWSCHRWRGTKTRWDRWRCCLGHQMHGCLETWIRGSRRKLAGHWHKRSHRHGKRCGGWHLRSKAHLGQWLRCWHLVHDQLLLPYIKCWVGRKNPQQSKITYIRIQRCQSMTSSSMYPQ